MYRHLNPNPTGKQNNDCLVRTLAIVFEIPWEKALMDLTQYAMLIYSMPNNDDTLSLYLKEKGFKREIIPNTCPACYTVKDFCMDHPEGTFIVLTSGHAIPVIDGYYYDATDSGNDIPMYYWEKER